MNKKEIAKKWQVIEEKINDFEYTNAIYTKKSLDFLFSVNEEKKITLSFSGLVPFYSVTDESCFNDTLNHREGLRGCGFYTIENSRLIDRYQKESMGIFEHGGYPLPIHISIVTFTEIVDIIFPELPKIEIN